MAIKPISAGYRMTVNVIKDLPYAWYVKIPSNSQEPFGECSLKKKFIYHKKLLIFNYPRSHTTGKITKPHALIVVQIKN